MEQELGALLERYPRESNGWNGEHAECPLTKTLINLDCSTVNKLFAKNGTGAPAVQWNPSCFDVTHPIVKSFAEFMWSGYKGTNSKEDLLSAVKPLSFEPWMMILEPVPGRPDFRYIKYGKEIAAMYGQDLTNRRTSEIGGHISEFFIALYSAVVIRKQVALSVHVPPVGVFATVWRRLIFPIMDETEAIKLIAAINVPDNELSAGLEALPDPALVANPDGLLMYANTSARRLFGEPTLPRTLTSDYCGIDIDLPADAEGYARAQSTGVSRIIGSRQQMVVHFELRTSATIFRGDPYFVVQLKPF